jgi:hypothetical protein
MSYIKVSLPKLEVLKKELENNPEKILMYQKYDVYLGDLESIEYLHSKLKEL